MQLRSTLGLVKGYLPAPAWHCTFYTPAGRQRRKLGSKNKRQAERRAREITEFIQREDWEALSKLDWRPRPNAGSFSIFVRAVTYGYCKTNPAASVTTKKEPVKVKDVLDDDEFERLLIELPEYSRRMKSSHSTTCGCNSSLCWVGDSPVRVHSRGR
jgi:hypothetical protein